MIPRQYDIVCCYVLGLVLESHVEYVVYVRAWYDADSYAIFASTGLDTDPSPPELSRATKVLDLRSAASTVDTDFLTTTSNVTFSWKGVFRDGQSAIKRYVVSISKTPGGLDVAKKHVTSVATQTTIGGLDMSPNDMYYGIVNAYNMANLLRTAYTDGFKVGQTRPGSALNIVNHHTCFINARSFKTTHTENIILGLLTLLRNYICMHLL